MLHSMTGYGISENTIGGYKWSVEIKTLNSKSIDISTRLPRELSSKEPDIRNLINQKLSRGKVFFTFDLLCIDPLLIKRNINKPLVKAYYEDISQLADELKLNKNDLMRLIFSFSEIYEQTDTVNIEPFWDKMVQSINNAIEKVNEFRVKEGKSLKNSLSQNAEFIKNNLDEIGKVKDDRIEVIKSKLNRRIKELENSINIDNDRLEQEILFYIEKIDISEEIVRLDAHIEHFFSALNETAPGKKLNFISQEIGREINTLGVKAYSTDIQKKVVHMKEELEKIKEQVLNVL